MPVIEESVVVSKPRAEVYAYVADTDAIMQWWSNVTKFDTTPPGPVTMGSVTEGATRVAGRSLPWTAKATDVQDGVTFSYESTESAISFNYTYRFDDTDGGTKVTFHQETGSFGGFFGKLADAIVTRMYTRDVKANLANLKELLEA